MISVNVEKRNNGIIIHITGEVHIENMRQVEDIWDKHMLKKPRMVAIDCKDIYYIDSSAIGMFVRFLNSATNKNIKLVFYEVNQGIYEIFQSARLHNFFAIATKEKVETELNSRAV
jgi:anti-sigma B factor antagonist